jgi:hypothetical protein
MKKQPTIIWLKYQEIIDHHNDGIYIDEALFFSAEIYNKS